MTESVMADLSRQLVMGCPEKSIKHTSRCVCKGISRQDWCLGQGTEKERFPSEYGWHYSMGWGPRQNTEAEQCEALTHTS